MGAKEVFLVLCAVLLVFLTIFYFVPVSTLDFNVKTGNYNFSTVPGQVMQQFYPNMRFPSSTISYRVSNCPLQEQNDMEYAFEIVSGMTPLVFYPVDSNEEIFVTCEDREVITNGMFIAGEGGPTNVTVAGEFDVITHGSILLIQESNCQKPNIAIHELFHVLGFGHSTNQENIMYNISSCDQTIGQDMLQTIDTLYSIPGFPDLVFTDVSATMSGRFLNVNMTVMNAGLNYAGSSSVLIYADGKVLKEIQLQELEIGQGLITSIYNIFVPQLKVEKLELVINNDFSEISKDNNRATLEIK